jgi:hypothetical protein
MGYNLGLESVAANQHQKEVVINDGLLRLDNAMTELLSVNLSSGNVTLTADQAQANLYFRASGNSVPRDLTFPAAKRLFLVEAGGTDAVTVKVGSTAIALAPDEIAGFYADGTTNGLKKVISAAGSGGTGGGGLTTLAGTTAGSAIWSQPVSGAVWKKVVVFLDAYANTSGVAQTITFPTPFTETPDLVRNSDPEASVSTTQLTLPADTTATGPVTTWIIIEGF